MNHLPAAATLDDLLRVEGQAELIRGRIVPSPPTGHRPNLIAGRIFRSLASHIDDLGHGDAYTHNMGFPVAELSSGRQSFSPDVSFADGPPPANAMRFVEGPPTFAVEVRSEGDYGPAAEAEIAAKRADYFEAGTRVVWDVDPIDNMIAAYHADAPDRSITFGPGQRADAGVAVPGWAVDVAWIFG